MRFNWTEFCRSHGVPFVTSGPNTAKGNISIQCPWCGSADPSQHLGLATDPGRPFWGCLRNANHRGKHPAKLVARLLGISYGAAVALVQGGAEVVDEFQSAVNRLRGQREQPERVAAEKPLSLPPECRPLNVGAYAGRFLQYLAHDRGFEGDAAEAADTYDLHYAITGPQAWRLVFPVYRPDGLLAGWTGRAIANAAIRYLTSEDMGKDVVLGGAGFPDGQTMLVCEGPLDWLKLDYYGAPVGCCAVATMGTSWTDGQLVALIPLMKRSKRTVVVLDRGTLGEGMQLAESLSLYGRQRVDAVQLPEPYKDPGEMPGTAVRAFCSALAG